MPKTGAAGLPPKSIVAAIAELCKRFFIYLCGFVTISYTLVSKSNVPKFDIHIGLYVEYTLLFFHDL